MTQAEKRTEEYLLHDFPVALSILLLVLFGLAWVLALSDSTPFKPVHYTLFNFLLVALFALQKYRRLEMNTLTQQLRLVSFGLLSGRDSVELDLSAITQVKVEPGIGGISGQSGQLLLCLRDRQPLVLSNTDLLPGSHKKLLKIRDEIDAWLAENRRV